MHLSDSLKKEEIESNIPLLKCSRIEKVKRNLKKIHGLSLFVIALVNVNITQHYITNIRDETEYFTGKPRSPLKKNGIFLFGHVLGSSSDRAIFITPS